MLPLQCTVGREGRRICKPVAPVDRRPRAFYARRISCSRMRAHQPPHQGRIKARSPAGQRGDGCLTAIVFGDGEVLQRKALSQPDNTPAPVAGGPGVQLAIIAAEGARAGLAINWDLLAPL